ncbi:2Fe-2S iron-sulfur cluster-binding protein [Sedimenticola selenatireducens]|uniref:2Fe-2S iron-sulfur cluster binding domain-containing protein n=1 Tax=Sedimenticola selenatireducens TaxID=191960 RepID=A0A557SK59_9GAMM|nr:2Fe-2S iron-sulfur cluster-binding protein [Sedimenticola selenatireducens]TVO77821.1 2Fe-2S iron-sulfur cluster binding domain-containing protein [Sedimenticola selenatireducens]TVT65126.1 MAG: 2Fe-2S iron-sulfur cluster binding domain-containing protein [Sedimenticola selenatireducens]
MTIGYLALIIFVVILAQVGMSMMLGLYRRHRTFKNKAGESAFETEHADSQGAALLNEDTGWKGFREFIVIRRQIEDTQASICSFYLKPIDGQPLPQFKPGQFLTFKLLIPDLATGQEKTVIRCYSLSDNYHPDYYRVSIKRVPSPDNRPELSPGVSSNYFHDHVEEGARLQIRAPSGHFHLIEEEALPVVLIGGGIGITPMLSILNTLLESGSQREIWLFYGVRNSSELVMQEHLRSLAKAHSRFHLHCCFSRPTVQEVEGVDYQHRGRVDISLLRATLKLQRYQFYICGPKPMMETLVPGLSELGVQSRDVYYESFGPATLVRQVRVKTKASQSVDKDINITFSKSGKKITWDQNAESLLEFAEAQGIDVQSGCRAGSCGSCQTAIESGEVEYSQQADADVESGNCLLCITRPKNNLTLAA